MYARGVGGRNQCLPSSGTLELGAELRPFDSNRLDRVEVRQLTAPVVTHIRERLLMRTSYCA